eukprot:17002-Chlamydomonas_euryale.AAC.6
MRHDREAAPRRARRPGRNPTAPAARCGRWARRSPPAAGRAAGNTSPPWAQLARQLRDRTSRQFQLYDWVGREDGETEAATEYWPPGSVSGAGAKTTAAPESWRGHRCECGGRGRGAALGRRMGRDRLRGSR